MEFISYCLGTASSLNNQGVEHLYTGQYEAALGVFRQGLEAVRSLGPHIHEHHEEQFDIAAFVSDNDHSNDNNNDNDNDNNKTRNVQSVHKTKKHHQDHSFYIFQRGLKVEAPVISSVELSAIITFNIALAQHLLALDPKRQEQKIRMLEQAVQLYECIYKTCTMQMSHDAHAFHSVDIDLMVLAVVNNLAQIHYEIGHPQIAVSLFRQLMPTLQLYKDHEDMLRDEGELLIDENEYMGLFLNVMACQDKPVVATAA